MGLVKIEKFGCLCFGNWWNGGPKLKIWKFYYDKPTWTVHKFQNSFLAIPWFWCWSIAKMWFFNLSLQIFDFLTFWPVMRVWVKKKFFDFFDFFHFSTLRTKIFKNFFRPVYSPGTWLLPGNTFGRVRCVSGNAPSQPLNIHSKFFKIHRDPTAEKAKIGYGLFLGVWVPPHSPFIGQKKFPPQGPPFPKNFKKPFSPKNYILKIFIWALPRSNSKTVGFHAKNPRHDPHGYRTGSPTKGRMTFLDHPLKSFLGKK